MKRIKRNFSLCAYRNCKNGFRNRNISFFKFPKDAQRCKLWIEACERYDLLLDKSTLNYRLCGEHFEETMFLNDLKNRLQSAAIPTIFESKIKTEIKSKWADIMKFHNYSYPPDKVASKASKQIEELEEEMQHENKIDMNLRKERDGAEEEFAPHEIAAEPPPQMYMQDDNKLLRKKVKRKVVKSPVKIKQTKLQMFQDFPSLFLGLKRNRMFLIASMSQTFDMNQRDVLVTLRKIKLNEQNQRIGNAFGLNETEVESLFNVSVPKIADCLRNFIVWPDDFTMKSNVPINLRQHFNKIHLILNYLVIKTKNNCKLVQNQRATFCDVEQCHKFKYLIASTLDGCVCFVSQGFGILTDDEDLLSRSGFLTKFKTNTNLIAGKNFHNFEDRLANGDDQNSDDDIDTTLTASDDNFEEIVSEKISKSRTFKLKNYIENILDNFESYSILNQKSFIDHKSIDLLDDIVIIVAALINLQKQEID